MLLRKFLHFQLGQIEERKPKAPEYIHIRKIYLLAMETGQFDQLPSPVQAKGMLTNYAEFLNLDIDAFILGQATTHTSYYLSYQLIVWLVF